MATPIAQGNSVLYVINAEDANQINRRHTDGGHIGNPTLVGDIYPAVVLRVWGTGENPPVNLRVFLDGSDTYWATSRHEDEDKGPGTWHRPLRGDEDLPPETA